MKLKRGILHAAKLTGLFALTRAATRRQLRILCYHAGTLGDECDYNPKLFCTSEQLRQRLEWLRRKRFVPATLDHVTVPGAAHAGGTPVVFTLDDGWYSSYRELLPLMAEYGHKPVLYLHTEAYEAGTPLIPVALRYIFWKAPQRKVELSGFGDAVDGVWDFARREERRRLFGVAEAWMEAQDSAATVACLERFAAALGISREALDLASRRFSYMTREELLQASANNCSIELHGHMHDYLPGQPEYNRTNIELCREKILAAGLPRPMHYCYPSGSFDSNAPQLMRELGVATAVTCKPGLVRPGGADMPYLLPRFLDGGNVSMIEFEAEMSGLLDFLRRLVPPRASRRKASPGP
jgi:peptidoglycan/xylan/chitin deacetylase (PgdA/CDA1 family)